MLELLAGRIRIWRKEFGAFGGHGTVPYDYYRMITIITSWLVCHSGYVVRHSEYVRS